MKKGKKPIKRIDLDIKPDGTTKILDVWSSSELINQDRLNSLSKSELDKVAKILDKIK
tara:strand:+ start:9815 stop:9988 length:174 start_codon:yes stop_codon:yes gene_type:complete